MLESCDITNVYMHIHTQRINYILRPSVHMCVYHCVCVYVCVRPCACVYVHIHVCVCGCVCTYVCVYQCVCLCIDGRHNVVYNHANGISSMSRHSVSIYACVFVRVTATPFLFLSS